MSKFWNPLERFFRIVLAYGVVYGISAVLKGQIGVEVPVWLIPIISAGLNALAKYFRDKWGIDIQL
jgi:hypothetical protein